MKIKCPFCKSEFLQEQSNKKLQCPRCLGLFALNAEVQINDYKNGNNPSARAFAITKPLPDYLI